MCYFMQPIIIDIILTTMPNVFSVEYVFAEADPHAVQVPLGEFVSSAGTCGPHRDSVRHRPTATCPV